MSMQNTVILITDKGMGKGPEELQLTLIDKYLQLLLQNEAPLGNLLLHRRGQIGFGWIPRADATAGIGNSGRPPDRLFDLPELLWLGRQSQGRDCRRHDRYTRSANQGGEGNHTLTHTADNFKKSPKFLYPGSFLTAYGKLSTDFRSLPDFGSLLTDY